MELAVILDGNNYALIPDYNKAYYFTCRYDDEKNHATPVPGYSVSTPEYIDDLLDDFGIILSCPCSRTQAEVSNCDV